MVPPVQEARVRRLTRSTFQRHAPLREVRRGPLNPFRNIFRLSVGDFIAKALNFLAFVFLARTLGVESYGVLELAIAIQVYLLLAGDAGLELWATREAARGADTRDLINGVLSIRVLLA